MNAQISQAIMITELEVALLELLEGDGDNRPRHKPSELIGIAESFGYASTDVSYVLCRMLEEGKIELNAERLIRLTQ